MSRFLIFLGLLSTATAAAGCGEVVTFTDAAGVDAPEVIDGDPPRITIRPHIQRNPAVGSTVLSHDGNGRLVERVVVDAGGVARVAVPDGGSITLVPLDVISAHGVLDVPAVITVYDVPPDGELVLGDPPAPAPVVLGTMKAAFSVQSGATIHEIATACDNALTNTTPATLDFQVGCVGGPFDVLGMTRGSPARALVLDDVTFTRGGFIPLQGTWPAAPFFTAFNRNLPAGITNVTVERVQFLDGRPAHTDQVFAVPAANAGNISFAVGHAPGVMRVEIQASRPGRIQALERQVPAALSHDVDLSAELLPLITPPVINPANGVVSWSEQGAGSVDAVAIQLRWNRAGTHRWTLYAPHGELSRRLPELPPDLADVGFGPTDVLAAGSQAHLVDTDVHDGWDDIRAGISPLFEEDGGNGHLEVAVYRESTGF